MVNPILSELPCGLIEHERQCFTAELALNADMSNVDVESAFVGWILARRDELRSQVEPQPTAEEAKRQIRELLRLA